MLMLATPLGLFTVLLIGTGLWLVLTLGLYFYRRAQFYQAQAQSKDRPSASSSNLSLTRLKEIASSEYGWDFNYYSDQLLPFVHGLRQAALAVQRTGLVIEGRRGCWHRSAEDYYLYPLVPVPLDHLAEFWINPPFGFGNWEVHTYKVGDAYSDRFRDLHVSDERAAREWLGGPADEFKTPQPTIDLRSALQHMVDYSPIGSMNDAVAAFLRAAQAGDLQVWGCCIVIFNDEKWSVSAHSKMRPGYWVYAVLDLDSFDFSGQHDTDDEFKRGWQRTLPSDPHNDRYCKLRVNKEQVLELWPILKTGGPLD